jgi:hypothetical protein
MVFRQDEDRLESRPEPALLVRFLLFLFGRFLNGHVVEFFGIEDVATFQAFNIFGVFVSGYNSNPWVFAGGNHRFDLARFDALAADCSGLLRVLKRQFGEIFLPSLCRAVPEGGFRPLND